ncbi:PilW family protein [Halomonas sp. E14]|uniref:PilW family protein n=1 Tax=Halomonas sp. E14 TaxID=3397245 RepID=UPI00403E749C
MFSFPAAKNTPRQTGFTLIELMVALVIGLIIILGAGQLFLMGFQSFRQIELLSNKQAALTFATEILIRDVRRANYIDFVDNELIIKFPNNGDMQSCNSAVERTYRLSESAVSVFEGWSLNMKQKCEGSTVEPNFEPLVAGFSQNGFGYDDDKTDKENGVWLIRFDLLASLDGSQADTFYFWAVNRWLAVKDP